MIGKRLIAALTLHVWRKSLSFLNGNKCQKQKPEKASKHLNKKERCGRRKKRGGFLNRYDFFYDGQDTAIEAMKCIDTLPPKLINQASKEIDKISEATIKQVINSGGQ